MTDESDFSATRRSVLKGIAAVASQSMGPGATQLGAEVAKALAVRLPTSFVEAVAHTVSHVACKFTASGFEEQVFDTLCTHAAHLFKIPRALRAELAAEPAIQEFFKTTAPSQNEVMRFSDASWLSDDRKLLQVLVGEWRELQRNAAAGSQAPIDTLYASRMAVTGNRQWPRQAWWSVPARDRTPKPPAWWDALDDAGKLQVNIEARFANLYGTPLNVFFDGDKLLDILRDNIGYRDEKNPGLNPARERLGMRYYLESFGPEEGPKEFIRGRTWTYRVEGLSAADARKKASGDFEAEKTPPVAAIERADHFPDLTTAAYTARLTAHESREAGFAQLLTLYHHLDAHLGLAHEEGGQPFSLRWKDGVLDIRVPKNSPGHAEMDRFCLSCFDWDKTWFGNQPYGLEPDYLRYHRERVEKDGVPAVVTHTSGPSREDFGRAPYEWDELRFHL